MRHQRVFEAGITASDKTMTFQQDAHVSAPTSFAFIEEYDGHAPGTDIVYQLKWRTVQANGADYKPEADVPTIIKADGADVKVYRYLAHDYMYPMLYIVRQENDEYTEGKAYTLYACRLWDKTSIAVKVGETSTSKTLAIPTSTDTETQKLIEYTGVKIVKLCDFDVLTENTESVPITTHKAVYTALKNSYFGQIYDKYTDNVQVNADYKANYHSINAQIIKALADSRAYSATVNVTGYDEDGTAQTFDMAQQSCMWCYSPLTTINTVGVDLSLVNSLVTFDHFSNPKTNANVIDNYPGLCEGDAIKIYLPKWQIRVKNTATITEVYAIRSHIYNFGMSSATDTPEEDIDYELGNVIGLMTEGVNAIPLLKSSYSGKLKYGRVKTQVYKVTF